MNNTANALLVSLIGLCGGLLVVASHTLLHKRIEVEQRRADQAIYFDVLQLVPNAATLNTTATIDDSALLGLRLPQRVYVAYRNARAIALVLPLTAREGYGGDIDLLVGIDTNGRIISVRALAQRETRGLGDAIDVDKNRWIEQFRGRSLDANNANTWQLRSEGGAFDQITGATVTSRAVIKSVRQALEYFAAHRRELLSESANE